MEMANCPKCGKLFSKTSSPLCVECSKVEEELFQKVKKYLEDNPNSSIQEISTANGISPKKVLRYLKEGRLEISNGLKGVLRCTQCGKSISSGRFCDKCIIDFNHEMDTAAAKRKAEAKSTYYTDKK